MPFKHLLLGLLIREPSSGYSLHKRIFEPQRPKLSQIYRTLKTLESEGFLESERIWDEKLPARKVYHATDAGRDELRRWLRGTDRTDLSLLELLRMLWFGSSASKEDMAAALKKLIESRKNELHFYQTKAMKRASKSLKRLGGGSDQFYWDLVFDYVQYATTKDIEWAEAALQRVLSFEPGGARATERPAEPLTALGGIGRR